MSGGHSMSDQVGPETAVSGAASTPVQEAPAAPQASAGALLRQAREAAGVELAALALSLKVPVKKLEALESDQFEQLPDAVFVRALASSVCRTLRIDPAEVLQLLPQTGGPRLALDDRGLKTPFQAPTDVSRVPFWDRLSRPMVLAALAILVGAMVLIFFPSTQQRSELAVVARNAAPQPPQPASPGEPAALPPATPEPVPPPEAVATPAATPAPAAPPAPAPRAIAAPAAEEDGDAPKVRRKLPSTGVVVFRTEGPSWVEVTDGRGNIQLSRLIEPGEVIGASGPLPLSVTVGRADVTQVEVRGKPFALADVTRQGVARFEVK